MLQSTALSDGHFSFGKRPVQTALLSVLQRHPGGHPFVTHGVIRQLGPSLIHDPQALPCCRTGRLRACSSCAPDGPQRADLVAAALQRLLRRTPKLKEATP